MNKKYRIARTRHYEVVAVYHDNGKWHLDNGDDYDCLEPYNEDELTFIDEEEDKNLSYWDKLEHQYAGMAMQAMLTNTVNPSSRKLEINSYATDIAHDLVNRFKNKI
jgi:hypothetical protein